MKTIKYVLILVFSFIFFSCEEGDTVVGTPDPPIPQLSFNVETTYVDVANKKLVAKGTVKNIGNSQVTSPWYIECQFYTDASRTIKLGGSNTQIGVPLDKNQSTFWTISFSSSNVNVTDYPNFAVGDLRGIY